MKKAPPERGYLGCWLALEDFVDGGVVLPPLFLHRGFSLPEPAQVRSAPTPPAVFPPLCLDKLGNASSVGAVLAFWADLQFFVDGAKGDEPVCLPSQQRAENLAPWIDLLEIKVGGNALDGFAAPSPSASRNLSVVFLDSPCP
jgi:hypothetical protein